MKKVTKGLCLILALVLLVCDCGIQTYAAGEDGSTQLTAIPLTTGKAKKVKFSTDGAGTYFNVTSNEVGRLRIALEGTETGCGATVELYRDSAEWLTWRQTKEIKYNKSKKKLSGKMTSEYVLPKGMYTVKVTPDKALKKVKKYSIKASIVDAGFDDIEPNNPEENAQPMDVSSKKGAKTYKMMLSYLGIADMADSMDCFTFDLKKAGKFHLKFAMKESLDSMSIAICQKGADGLTVVQRYDLTGKKLDKKVNLKKGTYIIKVWYYGGRSIQIPYTISGSVK